MCNHPALGIPGESELLVRAGGGLGRNVACDVLRPLCDSDDVLRRCFITISVRPIRPRYVSESSLEG